MEHVRDRSQAVLTADAKIAFMKNFIQPNIPEQLRGKVYLIDDQVETTLGIMNQCKGAIIPISPIVPRNANRIPFLVENKISYTPLRDIPNLIQTL